MGRTNQLRHRCETIVRTETAHVAGAATAMSYKEAGIDEYTYLATLDLKTSEICRSLDQKTFPLSEKQEGVNYPPMHPNCRSTTYFSITKNSHSMRAARDPITGKSVEVPEDWDYERWYEERVVKGNTKTYHSDDDWQETVYGKKSGKGKNDIFEELFKDSTGTTKVKNRKNRDIINKEKATDLFDHPDNVSDKHITAIGIAEELDKTEIGRETADYFTKTGIKPRLVYEKQRHDNRGEQQGDRITIFMGNISNARVAAQTVIHEATHHKYGIGHSQWAEAVCMAKEKMHIVNRMKLTEELRYIVKLARTAYPEYEWKKGGYGHRK